MDKKLEEIVKSLQTDFDGKVEEFRDEAHVFVHPEQIVEVITSLRDKHKFELLSALTAVDYWPQGSISPKIPASSPKGDEEQGQEARFHVIYQLTSLTKNLSIQIRVPIAAIKPTIASVSAVFASANWREREIWDMFGIHVDGHPDLRRILMPADWEGHPLRKDYPLGYEEPQFTFNIDEIDLRKPYAKE
ncbi:MAG: NADH-quinone oxidoreductase subunit C [Anaerolineae bacterium]|nr:NADH-quinone oxidoreductase subunit C [Anaerolineae bacterium]